MSLLQTAEALWQEAYRCLDSVPRITPSATLSPSHSSLLSPLSSAPSAPSDGEHLAALQRASQYLHAGLELVLPTALELRFRLLLARLLLQHTEDGDADAREHLRKCLQLVKSRAGDCPLSLKFLAVSLWAASTMAMGPVSGGNGKSAPASSMPSDASVMRHVREMRKAAMDSGQFNWWMHFDWWSWTRGHGSLLQESISRLDGMIHEELGGLSENAHNANHDHDEGSDTASPLTARSAVLLMKECRLFTLLLLGYEDASGVLDSMEEAALELIEQYDCTSTIVMIVALACLRERMERGEATAARLLYERASPHVPSVMDGQLPGMLRVDPTTVRMAWARIVGIMSLRAGEIPTDLIRVLIPDEVRRFQALSEHGTLNEEGGSSLPSSAHSPVANVYAEQLGRLTALLERLQGPPKAEDPDPSPMDVSSQLSEIITCCPQLESYRLLISALASHQARQPVHQTKGSLLEALKLLNGTTQNVFLKTLALLLVGQLYLETDWEMAVKMNAAAYAFATGADWHHLGLIASHHLALAHHRLGQDGEAAEYHRRADTHQRILHETDPRLLLAIKGYCT